MPGKLLEEETVKVLIGRSVPWSGDRGTGLRSGLRLPAGARALRRMPLRLSLNLFLAIMSKV